jgi:hypothetical protein
LAFVPFERHLLLNFHEPIAAVVHHIVRYLLRQAGRLAYRVRMNT